MHGLNMKSLYFCFSDTYINFKPEKDLLRDWRDGLAVKRALAALAEHQGSIPSTPWWLTTVCTSSLRGLMPSIGTRCAHGAHTYMHTGKALKHIKQIVIKYILSGGCTQETVQKQTDI